MTTTDTERALLRFASRSGSKTLGRMDIYVDGVSGNDTADGSASSPVATLRAAYSLIPDHIEDPVVVHLGPHAGDGYDIATLRGRILGENVYVISDTFTEIATGTATAGSGSAVVVDSVGGLTVDTYLCKTIEITSGAAAGDRRTVQINDASDITPLAPFSAAVASGDTYRIVEPAVELYGSTESLFTIAENVPGLGGTLEDGRPSIVFVNLRFNLPNISGDHNSNIQRSTLVFYGCEVSGNGLALTGSDDSNYFSGMDAAIPGIGNIAESPTRDLLVSSNTKWLGWGLSFAQGSGDESFFTGASVRGYFILGDAGHIVRTGSVRIENCRLAGGSFTLLSGAEDRVCHVTMYGDFTIPALIEGTFNVQGAQATALIVAATIDAADEGVISSEGGYCRLSPFVTVTTTGGATGLLAQSGGRIAFIGAPSVTTSGDETEVVDAEGVNSTRAIAGYSGGGYIAAGPTSIIRLS